MKDSPKTPAKRPKKGKDRLKPSANLKLAEQRRKQLKKHYASRYRSR